MSLRWEIKFFSHTKRGPSQCTKFERNIQWTIKQSGKEQLFALKQLKVCYKTNGFNFVYLFNFMQKCWLHNLNVSRQEIGRCCNENVKKTTYNAFDLWSGRRRRTKKIALCQEVSHLQQKKKHFTFIIVRKVHDVPGNGFNTSRNKN